MKSKLFAPIVITIIFIFLLTNSCSDVSQPTSPEDIEQTGLSGRVIDNSNQEGVEGVLLQLTDGEIELERRTEANGKFTFTEIEYGEYILIIRPPSGYENISGSEMPVTVGDDVDITVELKPIKEITKTVSEGTSDTLSTSSGAQLIVDASTSATSLTVSLREAVNYNFGEITTLTQPVEITFGRGSSSGSGMNKATGSQDGLIDISLNIRYQGEPETSMMVFNSGTENEPFLTFADGEKILFTDPTTGSEYFVYKHTFSIPSSYNSSATVSMTGRDLQCDSRYREFYEIEKAMNGNIPLVLIHGLQPRKTECKDFSNFLPETETFGSLISALQSSSQLAEKFRLYVYKYPTFTTIEENATALEDLMSEFDEVIIIAHSMGGLVARKAMENSEITNSIITLGTPHFGTPMADLLSNKNVRNEARKKLCDFNSNQKGCPAIQMGTSIFPVTFGLFDLMTDSPIINRLQPSENVITLGGDLLDIDEISDFSGLSGPMKRSVYRLGYRYMDEVLESSGDGMVEITSAVPEWSSNGLIFNDYDHDGIVSGKNGNISSVFNYIESILLSHTKDHDGFTTSDDFALTEERFDEDSDWDQIILDLMGSDYRVADWNDLVDYYNDYGGEEILTMLEGLGVTERGTFAYLTRNGNRKYSSTRYYLVARHDHNVPFNWLVHSNINNNLLSLGSWRNPLPILAIRRD